MGVDFSSLDYLDRRTFRFRNRWYLWFFCPVFFITPFAFLYIGIKAKSNLWKFLFFVSIAIEIAVIASVSYLSWSASFFLAAFTWLAAVGYLFATSNRFLDIIERQRFNLPSPEPVAQPSRSEFQQMAIDILSELKHWETVIKDVETKQNIHKFIGVINAVITLNNELSGMRFMSRYRDTLDKLLGKFYELENSSLNHTLEMKHTMDNIENSLPKMVQAAEKEVAEMYRYDLQDVNAQSTVFLQDLRNRGLID